MSLVAYASSEEDSDAEEPAGEEEEAADSPPAAAEQPSSRGLFAALPPPRAPAVPPSFLMGPPPTVSGFGSAPPGRAGAESPPEPAASGDGAAESPRPRGLLLPPPRNAATAASPLSPPPAASPGAGLGLPKPKKRTEPVRIAAPELHKGDSDSEEDEPAKKKNTLQLHSCENALDVRVQSQSSLELVSEPRLFLIIHKIPDWFGLEGTLKPIHSHLPLSQITPSLVQPGIEHFKGWSSHSFSGHPVPRPHCPEREEFLPNAPSVPALWQWEAISLVLALQTLVKNPSKHLLVCPSGGISPMAWCCSRIAVRTNWFPFPCQDYYSSGYYPEVEPAQPPPQETSTDSSFIDDEAFKRLQGKRNRGREEINFVDIKGDDQLSGAQQWLTKSLTEEKTMKSFSKKKGDQPTGQQRRKHQITYLIHQAKERELELKNTWSENKLSRRQTQAKYGF
ncbi:PRCC protein, partial [Cercotrichas coryphoeus]|nr:PRCC protein [Cercotrichas coryphoeus]